MMPEQELTALKEDYFQLVEGLCPEHAANLINFLLAKRLQRIEWALFGIEKSIETKPQMTIHMPDGSSKTFGTKKDAIGDGK